MKVRNIQKMLIGIVMLLCMAAINTQAAEYTHEVKSKKIAFAWKVDGNKLAVKLTAETDGWVGIGFNPTSEMKGANFILGYVKNGVAEVEDDFGTDENLHNPDTKLGGTSDVTLVGGTETGGVTTIEFTIPLNASDKNDTKIDVNGDTTVLLAYGAGRDSFMSRHTYRTTVKVNLSTGAAQNLE